MMAVAVLVQEEQDEMVERRRELLHRKQFLRDTSDPFMMGDQVFRRHYRMTPHVAIELIELLRPRLTDHPHGIPPHLQVLSVLRFMSEGSYQKGVSQDNNHPMSQSSFSKYLHSVIPAILYLADRFIVFPRNRVERQEISRRFQESIGFPGVLGAIDCTLPKIHTPVDHEEAFVNHYHDHSLNVQMVCDMNYNIMNVRIVNGSTNDRFVWRHSEMRQIMYGLRNDPDIVRDEGPYYLIGDGGYTPSRVLLTPCQDALPNTPQFAYSNALRRTRCRIERTFGILKEIFRCLNGDRCLHYSPDFAAQITFACAILYNFLRHQGMPMPVPPMNQRRQVPNDFEIDEEYVEGLEERRLIINRYFA